MPIFNNAALLDENGEKSLIPVADITNREDFTAIKDKLLCPAPGCKARLVISRRPTGDCLCKHAGDSHDLACPYHPDNHTKYVRTKNTIRVSGSLSSRGIARRKREMIASLNDALHPNGESHPKGVSEKTKTTKTIKDSTVDQDSLVTSAKNIQVVLDESLPPFTTTDDNARVIEPTFTRRLPNELTKSDNGLNVKTWGEIISMSVDESNLYCHFIIKFNGKNTTVSCPESFFAIQKRGDVTSEQFAKFLVIIANYVNSKSKRLFLLTLCQPEALADGGQQVSVHNRHYIEFIDDNNRKFSSVDNLASAISAGHI